MSFVMRDDLVSKIRRWVGGWLSLVSLVSLVSALVGGIQIPEERQELFLSTL